MNPIEIGKAYDQITHLWESDEFNRNNGIEEHKRAIKFAQNRGKALDVGCGCTGRFIELLKQEGFSPEGVDVSERMVHLAKIRNPSVIFYHKDICEWTMKDKYEFITAWDSLWHIPLHQQSLVINKLVSSLNVGGVLIFSLGGTNEEDQHTDEFMGPKMYYSTLGINGFLRLFMDLGCVCRHLEYSQYPELHTYVIVQKA